MTTELFKLPDPVDEPAPSSASTAMYDALQAAFNKAWPGSHASPKLLRALTAAALEQVDIINHPPLLVSGQLNEDPVIYPGKVLYTRQIPGFCIVEDPTLPVNQIHMKAGTITVGKLV